MRTIDIPPSRIEPQERLTLDLPAPDGSPEADAAEPIEAPTVRETAAEPSAEQLAFDAIAAAEAAKLREANAAQLSAAQAQLKQISADQSAQQDRLAEYRQERAAHAAAMSEYEAQLAAARADRERWEADVAACRAGDRLRCAPGDGRR
jgi:septal ring factor EnvC (AmiA/AmiB activator)